MCLTITFKYDDRPNRAKGLIIMRVSYIKLKKTTNNEVLNK